MMESRRFVDKELCDERSKAFRADLVEIKDDVKEIKDFLFKNGSKTVPKWLLATIITLFTSVLGAVILMLSMKF